MAGNKDNIVIKSARIELDDVDLGYTINGATISREREYSDVILPSGKRVSGKRKVFERVFVSTTLLESSVSNLSKAWDMDSGLVQSDDVHEYTLKIYVGDEVSPSYSYDKAVSIDAGEITYSRKGVAQIPVRFEVLLGEAITGESATLVSIGGSDMPAQFSYSVSRPKRTTVMETFGDIKRSTVTQNLKDSMISFNCPNCSYAQKTIIENLYLNNVDSTIAFTGLHSEAWDVFFETLDAPVEERGEWTLSGALRISAVTT